MNVQEVINIAKERKSRNKETIKKLVENIHKKIKNYALLKKESCTYMVPPLVDDKPLYDLGDVVKEIFKILDSEGYIVSAYSNGQIDISWNEKLVEQKVKSDAYLLVQEERKLKKITRKTKKIDERYSFLANPKKTHNDSTRTLDLDEQIDKQIEKILKEKESLQNKYSKIINK